MRGSTSKWHFTYPYVVVYLIQDVWVVHPIIRVRKKPDLLTIIVRVPSSCDYIHYLLLMVYHRPANYGGHPLECLATEMVQAGPG